MSIEQEKSNTPPGYDPNCLMCNLRRNPYCLKCHALGMGHACVDHRTPCGKHPAKTIELPAMKFEVDEPTPPAKSAPEVAAASDSDIEAPLVRERIPWRTKTHHGEIERHRDGGYDTVGFAHDGVKVKASERRMPKTGYYLKPSVEEVKKLVIENCGPLLGEDAVAAFEDETPEPVKPSAALQAAKIDEQPYDPSSPAAVAQHLAETARLIEEARKHPEITGLTAEEIAYLDKRMGTPTERMTIFRTLPTYGQVPAFFAVLPRWVCWRKVPDENNPEKFRKLPCSPVTGKAIGAVEKYAAEFTDFGRARSAAVRYKMAGVGFVFRRGDKLVGIDIDGAVDSNGAIDPEAQNWLRWFSLTWAEFSPSGRGVHIIGHATISKALTATALSKTSAATVEVYSADRFFCVTGKLLPDFPLEVQDIQVGITKLLDHLKVTEQVASDSESQSEQRPMGKQTARRIHAQNLESLLHAPDGAGNSLLNTTAFFCSRAFAAGVFEETEEQLKEQILDIVLRRWPNPHPEHGARMTVNSGWESGKSQPLTIASLGRTDAANAERFVTQHADKARYCGTDKMWYVWDGKRWAPGLRGEAVRLALDTVRSIYVEVAKITDGDERNDLIAWAKKSEMAPQVLNMLKLAASFKEAAIISSDLDADPWLLTVENGTVELKTGRLREHRREDLISKMVHVRFEPLASCPVWEEHLRLVLPQADTRAFFQRAAGYSLTGLDVEEVFFFLQGGGQNGKSKTLEILAMLLGDYAWTSTFGAFVRSHNGVPLNVIADMMGRRFVVIDEGEENQSFNESLLKNMTGGGTVSGRQLYSRSVNYRPTFKLWFGSNYKPSIQGMDLAIWRRVRLIPFGVTIPEERRDKFFVEKLKAELPGILNWALAGLAEWQKTGLGASEEVRAATRAYRTEMDTVKEFIEECCERRARGETKLASIYNTFQEWSKQNGNQWPLKKRAFAERMRKMGFDIPDSGTHARVVKGIALVSIF
jgi:putative DNA primase/helicase